MKTNGLITCFFCQGRGSILIFMRPEPLPCQRCNGTGEIPEIHAEWREKGLVIRDKRRSERIGQHAEAQRLGIPASVYSSYEQGWRNPEELKELEAALAKAAGTEQS